MSDSKLVTVNRALISVSDKSGIVEFFVADAAAATDAAIFIQTPLEPAVADVKQKRPTVAHSPATASLDSVILPDTMDLSPRLVRITSAPVSSIPAARPDTTPAGVSTDISRPCNQSC